MAATAFGCALELLFGFQEFLVEAGRALASQEGEFHRAGVEI
jgi:hypothetical protein